jgi:hypothetical protein
MHPATFNPSQLLAIGQYYRVNSFDLGFINIMPTDLLVEVKRIDRQANELDLAVLPVSANDISESLIDIAKWFTEVYPQRTRDNCIFKNAIAFERLVSNGMAVLQTTPPSLPVTIPSSGTIPTSPRQTRQAH